MKPTILIKILLAAGLPLSCLGQTSEWICYMENTAKASSTPGSYQDTTYRPYIPYTYEESIPIRVNLVFLQQDDGTGGFQENDPEQQLLWNDIEAKVNAMYVSFIDQDSQNCYLWKDPFLSDAKIHFVFNRIYIKDSYAWNRKNYSSHWGEPGDPQCPPLNYITYLQKKIENDYPLGINVFCTEVPEIWNTYQYCEEFINADSILPAVFGGWGCSESPESGSYSQIHMPDLYSKFLWMKYVVPVRDMVPWDRSGNRNVWWWEVNSLAASLAHELGHSLNLDHWCSHYETNKCAHALMHQGNINQYHSHNYIPPTEIGKIHQALSTTHLKNFIPKDLLPVGTMETKKDLTWNKNFRSYTNIEITTSGRITANTGIQMPQKSHINVNGQLYIRNGDVECVMEDGTWNGIRVKEDGVLWLENTAISDYDIVMESGSTLILKGEVTISNNHKIVLGNGCYICIAPNTTINGDNRPFYVEGNVSCGIAPGTSLQQTTTCNTQTWNAFLRNLNYIPDVLYIQNQQITSDQTFVAKEIVVGSNVTSSQTSGQVTIKNGAHVNFISVEGTRFDKGFRCENEASFIVTKIED